AIREDILDLPDQVFPPTPGQVAERLGEDLKLRLLALNECPYPPSAQVVRAIAQAAETANRYPDPQGRKLTRALAKRTGHPAEQIVLGNGSDELIFLLTLVTREEGAESIMPAPAFPGYRRAAVTLGAKPVTVPLREDGSTDVGGMLAAVTRRTRILFCAPVNNPIGGLMEDADLRRIIQETPPDILLVIDDAYHEYALHAGANDVLPLLKARSGPWAVLRTLSKAYALAGLRIGYCLCGDNDVAQALLKVKTVFNVNSLAQAAGLACLKDDAHRDRILDSCAQERRRLHDGVAEMGLASPRSIANFLTVRLPVPGQTVAAALARRGILVKAGMEPGYEDTIRVSAGLAEDTRALLDNLLKILKDVAPPDAAD
ncbi:MAG: aminotransferase class I/II-fold pyridoxal phosphate-dependent enzyme, partial [Proteobacteria bacterium]|nr:aminotransferase class I/II-fold pyridoxal phosphate-dependent enzyme [Pseudomonadota bacterium]